MNQWSPYPFLRITGAFILGILAALHKVIVIPTPLIISALFFMALLGLTFFASRKRFYSLKTITGVVALTLTFIFGYIHFNFFQASNDPFHILYQKKAIIYYTATIVDEVSDKGNFAKRKARIEKVKTENGWEKAEGVVQLYQKKQANTPLMHYGDKIVVKGTPTLVKEPGQEYEFNFKNYLQQQNIYHQHFLRKNNFFVFDHQPPSLWIAKSLDTRSYCKDILEKYIVAGPELAIAKALVLGINETDERISDAYASTGTIHVLAVSGLHVTFIYAIVSAILGLLLARLKNNTALKWVKAIIALFILWGYAFVTGLSPSVLRSVTMFSFVVIAPCISRQTNIYNTLAVSAFMLLLYNPYYIVSVGFLLSFSAVAGIVYLHPKIYNLKEIDNYVLDKIWESGSISLAATIATFPLTILYFHQFPVYFLLANLLVVPASSLILIGGILLLIFDMVFLSPLSYILGILLKWLIYFTNEFVFFFEKLPFNNINSINISNWQVVLLYLLIIFLLLLLTYRKFTYFLVSFLIFFSFISLEVVDFLKVANQKKVIFYGLSKEPVVDFIDGSGSYLYSNGEHQSNSKFYKYNILPAHLQFEIKKASRNICERDIGGNRVVAWNNRSFIFINRKFYAFASKQKLKVDYVVIGKESVRDLAKIKDYYLFKEIIIDNSNRKRHAELLKQQADSLGIRYHSIPHNGTYILNI